MARKKSFILYVEYEKYFKLLPPIQQARLIEALFAKLKDEDVSEIKSKMNTACEMAFEFMSTQMDYDAKKYEQVCDKNRQNILKRWNKEDTTEYDRIRNDTTEYEAIPNDTKDKIRQDNIIYNNKRNTLPRSVKKSAPPTKEDVIAYAKTRDRLDLAVKFWEYYEAGNWKDVTGATVKSWKQKFLTWCNKQPKSNNSVIVQETYTKDEFDGVFDKFKEMEV